MSEILTREEAIRLLRLDVDDGDPKERLRNLIRRQGLPCVRVGRMLRFRRSAIEKWLDQHADGGTLGR